ncbi:helix-turn-helix domain-containing protein [Emticicia sp. BO119]|uniref:helix-turn-helix domain-containing protein n=1 Tax=Emticicia sp. BO119 TaxID=2757768 RepID=UPI0015F03AB0|nr:helix-turn-helix transcriptional regulator [Emticicia sp. BO119]MBA4851338.1 helix-turn-helix transcriptional regulator [Emticicia sp. BO119]
MFWCCLRGVVIDLEFSNFILEAIHYRALAALAKKAGVSTAYVSHIETGVKKPTFRLTVKIAKALKVDWKELAISPITKKIQSLDISELEKQKLNAVLTSISGSLA